MPKALTASDRSALIRLASTLPAGSGERRAILAGLKQARAPRENQTAGRLSADMRKREDEIEFLSSAGGKVLKTYRSVWMEAARLAETYEGSPSYFPDHDWGVEQDQWEITNQLGMRAAALRQTAQRLRQLVDELESFAAQAKKVADSLS